MAGEVSDDFSVSGIEQFRIETFMCVIDQVCQQMNSRFSDQNVLFQKQLSYFTPVSLMNSSDSHVSGKEDIRGLCEQYNFNVDDIYSELCDFQKIYKVCVTATQTGTLDSG